MNDGTLGGIVGSISTVFDKYHAPEIMDYLSLDVEGNKGVMIKIETAHHSYCLFVSAVYCTKCKWVTYLK